MKPALFAVLTLALVATLACQGAPPPTPAPLAPTPDIPATVTAHIRSLPTPVPLPTYTPYPTATPYPTPVPLATHTPYPTPVPPTPIIKVERDNWTEVPRADGNSYVTIGTDLSGWTGTWTLTAACGSDGRPGVFIHEGDGIFSGTSPQGDDTLLMEIDGAATERTWTYYPPTADYRRDVYSAGFASSLINQLMHAETFLVNIPTAGAPYVLLFNVAGLDTHLDTADDVCRPPNSTNGGS